jgi:hypothetical protein
VVEQVELKLAVEPAIYLPGKPLHLQIDLPGYQNGSAFSLVVHAPEGVQPADLALADALTVERSLTLPVTSGTTRLTWQIAPTAQPPFVFSVDLIKNGVTLASDTAMIDAGRYETAPDRQGAIAAQANGVRLDVPVGASNQPLVLDVRNPSPHKMPAVSLTGRPIEIIAVGQTSGENVTHFQQPLTLQIQYDPQNIFNWREENLVVFYYNETDHDWYPLPTTVDTQTRTLTAQTDHLTVFDYKSATWQAHSLPLIDASVNSFSGAGSYDLNLWTPPGPGGLQPELKLSYNSQVIDESGAFTQASWVGMGWSLDTGSISVNFHETDLVTSLLAPDPTVDDSFYLSLNGMGGLMLPVSGEGQNVITYATANQSYLKIERNVSAETWTVYDKSGTIYTFEGLQRSRTSSAPKANALDDLNLTWRWSLSSVEDRYHNRITYQYAQEKKTPYVNDLAVYPATITYANGHYRVRFETQTRQDYQTSWTDLDQRVLFSTQRLKTVWIEQQPENAPNTWVPIRQYEFSYAANDATSNVINPGTKWVSPNGDGRTLTLTAVQEKSGDGSLVLPATQFTYGDGLHLTAVDNSQGGKVELQYEPWFYADSINPTLQGVDSKPCDAYGGSLGWERIGGYARCDWSNLQLGQYASQDGSSPYQGPGQEKYSLPEKLVKPGGKLQLSLVIKSLPGWVTNPSGIWVETSGVVWKLRDYTNQLNAPSPALQDTATYPDYKTLQHDVSLPVGFDPTNTVLQVECDACRISRFKIILYPGYYRVTAKTITDAVTGRASTYTYNYEHPSPNSATVSSAVAGADAEYTNLYNYPLREFRGHALSRVLDPSGLATFSYFYQSDLLKGQPYHTLTLRNQAGDVFDPLTNLDGWQVSSQGSHQITKIDGVDFEGVFQSNNSQADWNESATRTTYTLANGKTAAALVRLSGANSQAEVGLTNAAGQFFGMILRPENGQYLARLRYNTSGGLQDGAAISLGDPARDERFHLDQWYVVLFLLDETNGFEVRLWQLDRPEISGSAVQSGYMPGAAWKYRQRVSAGTLSLDTYFDGVLFSESETRFAADLQYYLAGGTTPGGDAYARITDNMLNNYRDFSVAWTYPTESFARTYGAGRLWQGTRAQSEFNPADQNGGQFGNLTRVITSSANSSNPTAWTPLRALQSFYWPQTTNAYLVSLPARVVSRDCSTGTCDFNGNVGLKAETLYLYDTNTTHAAPPTAGEMKIQRVRAADSSAPTAARYKQTDYTYF